MIYLLDTNTLVYALNRQGGVRERVNDAALRNRSRDEQSLCDNSILLGFCIA